MKQYKVTVNGTEYEVTIESQGRSTGGYNAPPVSRRTAPPIAAPTEAPVMPTAKEKSVPKIKPGEDGGKNVTSPMNGTIISVKTAVGQTVNAGDMLYAIDCALDVYKNHPQRWREMMQRAMTEDFSWKASAKEYRKLYNRLAK